MPGEGWVRVGIGWPKEARIAAVAVYDTKDEAKRAAGNLADDGIAITVARIEWDEPADA